MPVISNSQLEDELNQSKKKSLNGVGGWLSLLVLVLMVLGPFQRFIDLTMDINRFDVLHPQLVDTDGYISYVRIMWIVCISTIGASIWAGYRLRKFMNPNSVRLAIFTIYLIGPGAQLLLLILFSGNYSVDRDAIGLGLVQSLFTSVFWHMFLVNSRRVKNTYYKVLPGMIKKNVGLVGPY